MKYPLYGCIIIASVYQDLVRVRPEWRLLGYLFVMDLASKQRPKQKWFCKSSGETNLEGKREAPLYVFRLFSLTEET